MPMINVVLDSSDGRPDSIILHHLVYECRLEIIILDKLLIGPK
jgi:hypothetical protein